ncbi:hypothetical protein J6590_050172 [Homalodisca vitripennis]|nr:hypothetical protein J6590_050172 [Homalodisca vitripennis]
MPIFVIQQLVRVLVKLQRSHYQRRTSSRIVDDAEKFPRAPSCRGTKGSKQQNRQLNSSRSDTSSSSSCLEAPGYYGSLHSVQSRQFTPPGVNQLLICSQSNKTCWFRDLFSSRKLSLLYFSYPLGKVCDWSVDLRVTDCWYTSGPLLTAGARPGNSSDHPLFSSPVQDSTLHKSLGMSYNRSLRLERRPTKVCDWSVDLRVTDCWYTSGPLLTAGARPGNSSDHPLFSSPVQDSTLHKSLGMSYNRSLRLERRPTSD